MYAPSHAGTRWVDRCRLACTAACHTLLGAPRCHVLCACSGGCGTDRVAFPPAPLQVRNEIQRTKIEMANEVIDAGR